jgi:hypothetical protein
MQNYLAGSNKIKVKQPALPALHAGARGVLSEFYEGPPI